MKNVDQLIARTLGIGLDDVVDGLEYQSIGQWDSLGHVSLMVALETEFGLTVDDELLLELRSVRAIREFARTGAAPVDPAVMPTAPTIAPAVHRGLDGIHVDRSSITYIGATDGVLEYRGYSIHDLAEQAAFEEVAYLLLTGELPGAAELEAFAKELRAHRRLPAPVLDLARSLAHAHPMDALRTCVSALGAFTGQDRGQGDETYDQAREAGVALVAQVPMLIAAHHAYRSGREPGVPTEDASHAEAFLTMLLGSRPSPAAVRFVNKGLIVHADHSANASAFSARIAVGCRSGMNAAITAAIATFAGPVHGGAAERVVDLIDQVGSPDRADAYVSGLHRRNQPVMGFGHRVYRAEDPRVRHLRATVEELSRERGDFRGLEIIEAVRVAMESYARHGVAPNVDLYAGLAYRLMGLPDDLAVPMFVAGRMAGWVAQALEQHLHNVLIRPLLSYVGPRGLRYPGAAA
ncbi:citrate/2-methylcitrate synthase [Kitasatospora sp. NPDC052896]|uniref:citrate/2-methylcitrate synthase n=1 Tax=Kitasatospora sp. NPDC052896 TaxID=3364061 RepID=UPI0037C88BA8